MAHQQYHALGGDRFLAADGADGLAGLGLEPHEVGINAKDFGNTTADFLLKGSQLRLLGEHDAVQVYDSPAALDHRLVCPAEHVGRIAAPVVWVGVREHLADVAQRGRTQQGVGHGVEQGVGIAVSDRSHIVRDSYPTQSKRSARREPMGVMANSDAE